MPKKLQLFKTETGKEFWMEVDVTPLPGKKKVAQIPGVAVTFEKAWEQIQPAIQSMSQKLKQIAPDAFEVKFGIKLSAAAGVIFTSGSAEANFEITLKYK